MESPGPLGRDLAKRGFDALARLTYLFRDFLGVLPFVITLAEGQEGNLLVLKAAFFLRVVRVGFVGIELRACGQG